MDDPRLSPALHREALRGLARLNGLSGSAGLLMAAITRMAAVGRPRPSVRVLDLGCGDGDLLAHLHRRSGSRITGTGLDRSPTAIALARERRLPGVAFHEADLLAPTPWPVAQGHHDVVVLSLFLHHFEPRDAVTLMHRAAVHARRGVVVLDLERSFTAWWCITAAAHLVTRCPVVHRDSALSVGAGFRPGELGLLARRAGLHDARVTRQFPFRLMLEWQKPPEDGTVLAPAKK